MGNGLSSASGRFEISRMTARSLAVWDIGGTNPRRIFRAQGAALAPQWSPDGRWIAFGAGYSFLGRTRPGRVMLVKPDGSEVGTLTSGPANAGFPSWSPDSEHIGFKDEAPLLDIPQPYGELFVMKADGSVQQALTDNRWEEGTPAWLPAP